MYKHYSTRCKETIASFISHKSCTRLYLPIDFFIPKIEMLHGLLKGIHSPCSFKFLMIGFNPFLNSGFSRYCFLYGNKCRSLRLTPTAIEFCARTRDFSSAYILGLTFCSTKGREGKSFIFMKTEAWALLSISLLKRGEGNSDMI